MIPLNHLHPMLVHFPIALIVFGFLAQIASMKFKNEICLSKTAFYLLICGTLMAVIAVLTGALFTNEFAGAAGAIRELHEHSAIITLILLSVTSLFSIIAKIKGSVSPNFQRSILVMYAAATLAVSITGYLGGKLVYSYLIPF